MQAFRALPRRDALEPGAQGGIAARPGKQASRERAVVESSPADEQRQPATRADCADRGGRLARVSRGGVLLGRVGHVDQMVRNTALFRHRHLVGADIEPAVDGGRIAAHDLPAETAGEREAERALPGGSRSDDRHQTSPRRHGASARASATITSTASSIRSPICCVRVGQVIRLRLGSGGTPEQSRLNGQRDRGSSPGRLFVEVERDGEERPRVGILGWQGHRRVGRQDRVARRQRERVD